MRKGHISLLLYNFAYIITFLCFQGEPSDFISKFSILGGLKRRIEVRGSPGHQEQGKLRKRAKARTGVKAQGRAPTTQLDQAGQQRGTAVPLVMRQGLCVSQFFVFGRFFHSAFFLAFFSSFRVLERGWRESQNLDLGFEFMLWIGDLSRFNNCSTFSINLYKFVLLLSPL